jgi:hypothetical protein
LATAGEEDTIAVAVAWSVRYSDNVLRLRMTGARQAAGVRLVIALCAFTFTGVFVATGPTTTIFFFTTHSTLGFVRSERPGSCS